jgi:SAM-dependent methyltransferase
MTIVANLNHRLTPAWLDLTCTLRGVRSGHRPTNFRVLVLSSGAGLTAAAVAAMYPEAEVVGVAPDPAAVAVARELARCSDLSNVRFVWSPFQAVADVGLDGDVDVLVGDEVLCSTDGEGRAAVAELIAQRLAPGGVLGLSYRALAGWSEASALHRTVRLMAQRFSGTPADRVRSVLRLLDKMSIAGAAFLQRPYIQGLLDDWAADDPAVVARQVLGRDLEPLSLAGTVDLLSGCGLSSVGSAQLLDDTGLTMPDHVRSLVDGVTDPVRREVLRDLVTHQTLRTDVFVRGERVVPPKEQARRLSSLMLIGAEGTGRRSSVETTTGAVAVPPEVFDVAHDVLANGVASVAQVAERIRATSPEFDDPELLVRLLVEGGVAVPYIGDRAHQGARASIERLAGVLADGKVPEFGRREALAVDALGRWLAGPESQAEQGDGR